jgi:hypothetical protein
MSRGDFESGRTVPVLIPEPVWQEWKTNGVGAESLAELKSEHGYSRYRPRSGWRKYFRQKHRAVPDRATLTH